MAWIDEYRIPVLTFWRTAICVLTQLLFLLLQVLCLFIADLKLFCGNMQIGNRCLLSLSLWCCLSHLCTSTPISYYKNTVVICRTWQQLRYWPTQRVVLFFSRTLPSILVSRHRTRHVRLKPCGSRKGPDCRHSLCRTETERDAHTYAYTKHSFLSWRQGLSG